ncbi:MAG: 5'-nucleotidase [Opitutaceae bacterium]
MCAATPSSELTKLVVGLSSSSLFDTAESNALYHERPLADYVDHQVTRENVPFPEGTAFPLAETMMRLNGEKKPFELVVLSKNEPVAGSRVMNSLAHYGFENVRAAFTGGEPIAQYCEALNIGLFLSRESREVKRALANGTAAGFLYAPPSEIKVEPDQLRIAFDFDGVLANLEAELVYQNTKPDIRPYRAHEVAKVDIPHPPGPLFPVLQKLSAIKTELAAGRRMMFPENENPDAKALALALKLDLGLVERVVRSGVPERALFRAADEGRLEAVGFSSSEATLIASRVRILFSPIEIALVTARNPPVEKRLMNTLRSWGVSVDQMFLMGGLEKTPVLRKFRAHIFFDDQEAHTTKACTSVPTSLIPWLDESLAQLPTKTPQMTSTAELDVPLAFSTTTQVRMDVLSARDFDAQCRAIFRPYTLASSGKAHQLDPRLRSFIEENRGRSGAERGEVLNRLKMFDISALAGTHTARLGRDRFDFLVRKLDWIAGGKPPQTEIEFKAEK